MANVVFIFAFYMDKLMSFLEETEEKEVLSVSYGTCTREGFPAASQGPEAPELFTGIHRNVDNQYVYIYPNPKDRFLAGYFVQVVGTRVLYKIGNYGDEAIVIGIPERLQGKQFTLQYAAYDTMNLVSNKIIVVVDPVEVLADDLSDARELDWMPENGL